MKNIYLLLIGALGLTAIFGGCENENPADQLNILFCISDDQSWIHTSIMGAPQIKTPGFDRVATEGILFNNAYCSAPSCAPSRASILSGRHIYDIKEGGLLFGGIPKDIDLFTDLLKMNGYDIGYTAKGYGPGKMDGEDFWNEEDILGKEYSKYEMKAPEEIGEIDYAKNFKKFLKDNKNIFYIGVGIAIAAGLAAYFAYQTYSVEIPLLKGAISRCQPQVVEVVRNITQVNTLTP